jgi:nucleoside-diphosphate-sugar epimerase
MRLLVLGGTAWLGRCIASTAVESGHQVTCLARGVSGAVPDGVARVTADRTQPGAYKEVSGQYWDVVIDVSSQPGQVKSAIAALADSAGLYVYVSTCSVYADNATPGQDETGPLLEPLDGDVMASLQTYGRAKVACEQHVWRAYGPDRALIARAGLIGGPGDTSDRTGYWPLRFARPAAQDGAVLVPDSSQNATQVIDVRDLTAWLLDASTRGVAGIFNAIGATLPLSRHIDAARSVAGHTGPVVRADPQWLLDQGVQEWMGARSLPLWVADPDWLGFGSRDGSKARTAGLRTRPLEQTLSDTLDWELTRDHAVARRAGLTDDDERALLEALTRT